MSATSFADRSSTRDRPLARNAKRLLDITVAGAALVVLLPVFAAIAVGIRCTSPGPVIFRQPRVGLNGSEFTILKFRTMRAGAEHDDRAHREQIARELAGVQEPVDGSFKLHDDGRVTRIGHLLRRYSLDELPQLVNVLRGEMSVVGPRPALAWEHTMFSPTQQRRTEVPPGITGLWQVSGRSALDTRAMLDLDLTYVDTWTLRGDVSIIFRTVTSAVRDRSAR